jgi:hypothetical protein
VEFTISSSSTVAAVRRPAAEQDGRRAATPSSVAGSLLASTLLLPPCRRAKPEDLRQLCSGIASSSPSGSVPGDGAGGRDDKLSTVGGEGPDCVFIFSCRVLSIKIQGRVAVKVSARSLDVNCNPTVSP